MPMEFGCSGPPQHLAKNGASPDAVRQLAETISTLRPCLCAAPVVSCARFTPNIPASLALAQALAAPGHSSSAPILEVFPASLPFEAFYSSSRRASVIAGSPATTLPSLMSWS